MHRNVDRLSNKTTEEVGKEMKITCGHIKLSMQICCNDFTSSSLKSLDFDCEELAALGELCQVGSGPPIGPMMRPFLSDSVVCQYNWCKLN